MCFVFLTLKKIWKFFTTAILLIINFFQSKDIIYCLVKHSNNIENVFYRATDKEAYYSAEARCVEIRPTYEVRMVIVADPNAYSGFRLKNRLSDQSER
ncbi:MAG: hypothetical protein BVN31_13735 [Proteobacteria bacterium ST_bin15]|nr:MAG: hypothetical protein BVN31_13735 [Proteobacteria bacterium ST_bin15]